MIKLTKEKLNEFLYYLSTDNPKNTLIFKLGYIYGKNMREVLILKPTDINIEKETITFNTYSEKVTYPLTKTLLDELLGYIYDNELKPDDYIFKNKNQKIEQGIKRLNEYLHATVMSLNKILDLNLPEITTKDFKILRGQHLYLEGVDLHTVHELIGGTNIKVTKNVINFKELHKLRFPCNNIDEVFTDYTDIEVLYEEGFHDSELYTVSSIDDNIIIEVMQATGEINIISSESNSLNEKLQEINPEYLFNELRSLKEQGQYKIIEDLRFLKN